MGILNVTPDSFSDGGRYLEPEAALGQAESLVSQGADVLDVGAESTRPGYVPIPWETEWKRLEPVLRLLLKTVKVPISVDTQKAEIAERAILLGASILNDVSGLADPKMMRVLAASQVGYVLMYNQRKEISNDFSSVDIRRWLLQRLTEMDAAGISAERVLVDPGLGFAYGIEANWAVLRNLEELVGLGAGLLVGPSRKRFLGQVIHRVDGERDSATAALSALLVNKGVDVIRVHRASMVKDAVNVADRLLRGDPHG
ncbi:MAG: dihydropteroate synthase [Firmicutes bacterium]|jgi:dihydropteroate synthase|nr:dihydropteroate synthase [Bacillota bacterium]MCL5065584.1 dihydropteroate synthase [Bacillota bacterium]